MKNIVLGLIALAVIGLMAYCYSRRAEVKNESSSTFFIGGFLAEELFKQLRLKYPEFNFSMHEGKIVSTTGLTVSSEIFNNRKYDDGETFQLNFYTTHPLFAKSIEERLVGIGANDTAAIINGVQSFLEGQFAVIVAAIEMKHSPEMDFVIIDENGNSHWHPIIGDIRVQGELHGKMDSMIYEKTYRVVRPLLEDRVKSSIGNFHWFRYYISKMADGEIIGDCYFDNEPYEEGLDALRTLAGGWETTEFTGQKQFIMLRLCKE